MFIYVYDRYRKFRCTRAYRYSGMCVGVNRFIHPTYFTDTHLRILWSLCDTEMSWFFSHLPPPEKAVKTVWKIKVVYTFFILFFYIIQ